MKLATFIFLAVLMFVNEVWADQDVCARAILCYGRYTIQQYEPLCVRSISSGNLKRFLNQCTLTTANCLEATRRCKNFAKYKEYVEVPSEQCRGINLNAYRYPDTKPVLCNDEYDSHLDEPLCARSRSNGDLKQFTSTCELNLTNCKEAYERGKDFTEYKEYVEVPSEQCQRIKIQGDQDPDPCPIMCNGEFDFLEDGPLCARSRSNKDIKAFTNSCTLSRENCREAFKRGKDFRTYEEYMKVPSDQCRGKPEHYSGANSI